MAIFMKKRLAPRRRRPLCVCSTVSAWRTAVNVGATRARQPRGTPLAREHAQVTAPGQAAGGSAAVAAACAALRFVRAASAPSGSPSGSSASAAAASAANTA